MLKNFSFKRQAVILREESAAFFMISLYFFLHTIPTIQLPVMLFQQMNLSSERAPHTKNTFDHTGK